MTNKFQTITNKEKDNAIKLTEQNNIYSFIREYGEIVQKENEIEEIKDKEFTKGFLEGACIGMVAASAITGLLFVVTDNPAMSIVPVIVSSVVMMIFNK